MPHSADSCYKAYDPQSEESAGQAALRGQMHPEVLALQDEKGAEFPVQTCCEHCYNRIYNSSTLNLFPYLERIRALDPVMLRLEFTTENREETIRVVREFFGDGASADHVTRGHFKRGVL